MELIPLAYRLSMDESFTSHLTLQDLNTSFNELKSKFEISKDQFDEFDKA